MNIVLLSGGSGQRLWPLSNETRSKQFIKIFKTDNGYLSMLQRVYQKIKKADAQADVTIATAQSQISAIKGQIGEVDISVEPCRRDTFPAIALAAAYLHDVKKKDPEESVVVCPVDPYVGDKYFEILKEMSREAATGKENIVLMGIRPTYPSEKYGYIIPASFGHVVKVNSFKEKPDTETALKLIAEGALWNGGVFAFRLGYLLALAEKTFGTAEYESLFKNYENLPKISFDYAVVEKEKNIKVIKYSGTWMDLGTWNTLTEVIGDDVIGKGLLDEHSRNTNIINELDIPVVSIGIDNAVIVSSPDGILVADKEKSPAIKDLAGKIKIRPMFEERQWGSFKVLEDCVSEDGMKSLTKHLVILPGKKISYQRHKCRKEIWTVVSGNGKLLLDGNISDVSAGKVITIEQGALHSIKAQTELHIIEVQLGNILAEEDIERVPFEW